ncbi:hypothetical protein [Rhodococcus sp. SORGH_AS_0303]|uniref:hypothetical protein n=1 Tax=Rhodococcus sp. SORGH_AS_0303 TaxID=3041753 RepID=UPI0027868E72|nr:hypothetical protein [Rhodococcus sp. SORGH_AS_0303]MDQ1202831.1 topoisomerase IA-like protein [Rhodococcus sp. SORGH_AS_0303]
MTATTEHRIHAVVSEADELERMGFTTRRPAEWEWQRICALTPCAGRQVYVQGGRYGQYLHDMTVHGIATIRGGDAGR